MSNAIVSKISSVLLCVLEQQRVDDSSYWSNDLRPALSSETSPKNLSFLCFADIVFSLSLIFRIVLSKPEPAYHF